MPGARNIRTLSARFIADMQTHWEKNGMSALDEVREKYPDRYVDNYVMLSRVIRLEADVKHSLAKPKTVDEALAELESRVGKEGRRKFEKFLREVGADEDVIDVEFEIRIVCSSHSWARRLSPGAGVIQAAGRPANALRLRIHNGDTPTYEMAVAANGVDAIFWHAHSPTFGTCSCRKVSNALTIRNPFWVPVGS